jgi:hypothetical protein
MRKHALAILFASSALLLAAVPSTFAASLPVRGDADGQPTIDQNSPTGYFLWREDGFHLRTHGPGAEHAFDAVLKTNGVFENVAAVRVEADDRVELRDGGHELVIHFHTFDSTDGVNFTIRDGERLRLSLKLDDQPISTDAIFVGVHGRHPERDPFAIRL